MRPYYRAIGGTARARVCVCCACGQPRYPPLSDPSRSDTDRSGVSPAGAHPRGCVHRRLFLGLLSSTRDLRPRARHGRSVLPPYAGARARTRASTDARLTRRLGTQRHRRRTERERHRRPPIRPCDTVTRRESLSRHARLHPSPKSTVTRLRIAVFTRLCVCVYVCARVQQRERAAEMRERRHSPAH